MTAARVIGPRAKTALALPYLHAKVGAAILSRDTHRVAIPDRRLVAGDDLQLCRCRPLAHGA
jgi:hypothetical protein